INHLDYLIPFFIETMENIVLWVAMGLIDFNFLKEIISSILYYEELTEKVKEKLVQIALAEENNK
ncbi:type II toxin-antitoxin system death-on-curing family toxin, partial [Streptococcus pneumoniae]|nr:type II toxin-antitoxin system death-on-curing family toxin [Streptococcus pneumoniae]